MTNLFRPQGAFGWFSYTTSRDTIELVYTFSVQLRPRWLGRMLDPVVNRIFEWETRNRFAAMEAYLRTCSEGQNL